MAVVIFAFPPDAPVFLRGILAGGGIETASSLSLASSGAEHFSDPLFEMVRRVARECGRWVELDGMSGRSSA
jgi:hypothetical protein